MAQNHWRISHRVAVSAISLLLGTGAEAVKFSSPLDPNGNGTVPGYDGTVTFDVDANCLGGTFTGWEAVGCVGSDCGSAFLDSASINLYSLGPGPKGPVLDTITFALADGFEAFGMFLQDGVPVAFDTGQMGPKSGTSTYSGTNFWLQLTTGCVSNPPALSSPSVSCSFLELMSVPEFMSANAVIDLDSGAYLSTSLGSPGVRTTNDLVFTQVPEPGTLGLLLGALGGGWLTRWRKKKAAT